MKDDILEIIRSCVEATCYEDFLYMTTSRTVFNQDHSEHDSIDKNKENSNKEEKPNISIKKISERSFCSELYHQIRLQEYKFNENVFENIGMRVTSEIPKSIRNILDPEVINNRIKRRFKRIKDQTKTVENETFAYLDYDDIEIIRQLKSLQIKDPSLIEKIIDRMNDSTIADSLTPDLLIHDPRSNSNACIIEVKTSDNIKPKSLQRDIKKIRFFMERIKYRVGIMIIVGISKQDLEKNQEYRKMMGNTGAKRINFIFADSIDNMKSWNVVLYRAEGMTVDRGFRI